MFFWYKKVKYILQLGKLVTSQVCVQVCKVFFKPFKWLFSIVLYIINLNSRYFVYPENKTYVELILFLLSFISTTSIIIVYHIQRRSSISGGPVNRSRIFITLIMKTQFTNNPQGMLKARHYSHSHLQSIVDWFHV